MASLAQKEKKRAYAREAKQKIDGNGWPNLVKPAALKRCALVFNFLWCPHASREKEWQLVIRVVGRRVRADGDREIPIAAVQREDLFSGSIDVEGRVQARARNASAVHVDFVGSFATLEQQRGIGATRAEGYMFAKPLPAVLSRAHIIEIDRLPRA